MNIYLPVAGLSVNALVLLSLGGGIGLLSGLFGVGGGFLLTPLLIFLGIPAPVAAATGANQVVGTSVSGAIAHWRRRNVDFKMGAILVVGGMIGSVIGVAIFAWLRRKGQIDLFINLCYVLFLGLVGGSMMWESVMAMVRRRRPRQPRKRHHHLYGHMPFKMRFPRSGLYVSALLPIQVGMVGGLLAAIMGVGGGFITVPMMIYLLEMPTAVVVGTSLFQAIFVTASVTVLQSAETHTVDVVLALTLLCGAAIGAQAGARIGAHLRAEQTRVLMALLVLGVCIRLIVALMSQPADAYFLAGSPLP